MSAGGEHSIAIRSDGKLFTWGSNGNGQLGIEVKPGGQTAEDLLGGRGTPTQVGEDDHWAIALAGRMHNHATKTDGTLWAWGSNSQAQLGDGTMLDKTTPVQIGTATNWLSIAPGSEHVLGLTSDGSAWAWGRNMEGQQGNGFVTTYPVLIPTLLPY